MSANNSSGRFGEIAQQAGIVVNTQHDTNDIKARNNVNETNAYIYPHAGATVDPATTKIDINDLVFTVGDGKCARRGMLNNAIPVASNCNGLFLYKNKAKYKVKSKPGDDRYDEEVRQALSESIRLIGQALGHTDPLPTSEELLKVNFTTRAAGTAHIINTGDQVIVPGETVCWDLFSKKDREDKAEWKKKFARYGYSVRKVPLKLVKLSHAWKSYEWALKHEVANRALTDKEQEKNRLLTSSGVFANAVLDFVKDVAYISDMGVSTPDDLKPSAMEANRVKDGDPLTVFNQLKDAIAAEKEKEPLLQKAISDLVQGIMYMVNDLDRRRVGTALGFAKPGKGLDINLQV